MCASWAACGALNAPVDDPVRVAVLDRRQDLPKEAARLLVADALVRDNVVEELAAGSVLQDQADLVGRF